ncbi:MAG: DUF4157 domain-containing protein [Bacteroidota bacterium]
MKGYQTKRPNSSPTQNRASVINHPALKQKQETPFFEKTPTHPFFQTVQRQKDTAGKQKSGQGNEAKIGLPNPLKAGIEQLSGYAMDDVKVHRNSDQPAQLQAHAFAQGTDIHLASGQEKHLPHEAWHVVQQKQGRVKPTVQMKGKLNINDDTSLEKEADVMGKKALHLNKNHSDTPSSIVQNMPIQNGIVQRVLSDDDKTKLKDDSSGIGADKVSILENARYDKAQDKIKAMPVASLQKIKLMDVVLFKELLNQLNGVAEFDYADYINIETGGQVLELGGAYAAPSGEAAAEAAAEAAGMSAGGISGAVGGGIAGGLDASKGRQAYREGKKTEGGALEWCARRLKRCC